MQVQVARATLLLCLLVGGLPVAAAGEEFNGFDVRGALVPIERIERGGPPRDGIPAIDRPRFVSATRAGLRPDVRILGLARAGEARAYPIRILNWHEVVNDRFGQEPIAITYCPLCGTGMAFIARSDSVELRFGVSGLLYNSDVLPYDRATESLWSQVGQQAISGRLAGRTLQAVPLEHTSWADWFVRHPRTQVLSTETGFARDYDRDPYAGYDRVQRLMFEVEHRDDRLALKQWVLGVKVGEARKAYPFSALERALSDAVTGRVRDRVGGREVEIRFDRSNRTAQAYDTDGQVLPSVIGFWFARAAFYPATQVYAPP